MAPKVVVADVAGPGGDEKLTRGQAIIDRSVARVADVARPGDGE